MTTMLEKMAARMAAEWPAYVGNVYVDPGLQSDRVKFDGVLDLTALARAALLAIREPDAGLAVDAFGAVVTTFESEIVHRTARDTFTAMIDEILNEKTKGRT